MDGATDIAFSPDGQDLYVVGRDDDAVVVLRRGESGSLLFVDAEIGLERAASIAVSQDGTQIYACGDQALARRGDHART